MDIPIRNPEDFKEHEEPVMVCLSLIDGVIPPSAVPQAVQGVCADCGVGIYFSRTAPANFKKLCRSCTFIRIQKDKEFDWAILETSVTEVLRALGLEDTPETRARILKQHKERLINWLREGAAEQAASNSSSSAWD